MKNSFVLGAWLVLLLSACSKNNDVSASGSITGNVDGSGTSFNNNVKAIRTDISGGHSISIVGFQGAGASNQIGIVVTSTQAIAAGTYSENSSSSEKIGTISYIQSGNPNPYINYNSQTNPTTVTVTSVSAASIQGTFSGDVFLTNSSGVTTTKKVITKGQFNVKF